MGYVFHEAANRVVRGVVHATWKERPRDGRKFMTLCDPTWVNTSTAKATRKHVTCLACLGELTLYAE